MLINEDLCIGCRQCVIVCTVQAIKLENEKAFIDRNKCIECSVCYQYADCPTKAIKPERLNWPRIIRNPFSSVVSTHKLTELPGRGTEEMKTNDITNRYKYGQIGFSIEIGRPGIGTLLKNIELFTTRLSKVGVIYEKESPVTAIIIDAEGHINPELKEERVLSAIIEFKISENKLNKVLKVIRDIGEIIDTVFTVGVITRVGEDDSIPVINLLEKEGFNVQPNAKVNLGLGKR
ncbi:MAG: 4Fe-4S binding protein [Candidatus Hermodarchaeota archaeon]